MNALNLAKELKAKLSTDKVQAVFAASEMSFIGDSEIPFQIHIDIIEACSPIGPVFDTHIFVPVGNNPQRGLWKELFEDFPPFASDNVGVFNWYNYWLEEDEFIKLLENMEKQGFWSHKIISLKDGMSAEDVEELSTRLMSYLSL